MPDIVVSDSLFLRVKGYAASITELLKSICEYTPINVHRIPSLLLSGYIIAYKVVEVKLIKCKTNNSGILINI